jgi:hypothetical protein
MAFIDPFEKITEDVNALFRPQREWVEGQGLFLVTGHFLSGIGAGTWLFALLIGSKPALIASLLIVAAGGLAHLLFLGCWQRFWRMVWHPQSSWISRGLLSMGLFSITGLIYILLAYGYLSAGLDSGFAKTMLVLSLLGMLGIFVYKGFVYAVSRAIPFWDTPLLPVLYIVYALRGGKADGVGRFLGNPFHRGHGAFLPRGDEGCGSNGQAIGIGVDRRPGLLGLLPGHGLIWHPGALGPGRRRLFCPAFPFVAGSGGDLLPYRRFLH